MIPQNPMQPIPFRVERMRAETYDTFTLQLTHQKGDASFHFAPGQFNMLYLFGVGEIPVSISGDPREAHALVHTTRAVGTVTKAMRKLKRGDAIGVRGPFGKHWPLADASGQDVVIVAGGIGLAPLRPALYQLMAERGKYGKVVLLYGARTPEDILYKRELQQWRAQFDLEVYVTVDRATSSWHGNVGVVTTLIPKAPFDPLHTTALVCGPEVMMRFTVQELFRRSVRAENTFVSLERNMKCAIGFCGHCQYGANFVCKDGPVFRFDQVQAVFGTREV